MRPPRRNGVGVSAYATQPFVEPLPIPPVKTPVATGPGCESFLKPGTIAGPLKQHVPFEGESTAAGHLPPALLAVRAAERLRARM